MVRGQLLVIVNRRDLLVNPLPARQFAGLLQQARLIELDSDCGHRAHACESQRINREVAAFLAH